jgi:hypothetical protein
MSIFTKRGEEGEEMPRPSEAPLHMTAHPGQPHTKLAALSSPPTMAVAAQGEHEHRTDRHD